VRRRHLIIGTAVVAFAAAAVLVTPLGRETATRLGTSWVAPQAGAGAVDDDLEAGAGRDLGAAFTGRIVWSSNRAGNHELFLLTLPSAELEQLTAHPNVDFGARFAPDGRSILFMRSRREWVSFRETGAWDVMLLDLDSGQERRLARRGYHPTWGPDGRSVVFLRGAAVVQLDLESGSERVLFDSAVTTDGRDIGDAELHPDGSTLALAVSRYGAITVAPGAAEYTRLTPRHVCQTTWIPGTRDLLWMEAEGNGGTRVVRGAADGSTREVFMDLPGDRSHEYFPKLSADGTWMVWAASAEGHEHDRADYEIFAWRVGDPWEEAIRITYFDGNDQWPDIYVDGGGPTPRP
jgi:Tol biopolymer transport system component